MYKVLKIAVLALLLPFQGFAAKGDSAVVAGNDCVARARAFDYF